ncbi:MAG: PhaM family polyhydroxyalkanoate granule multifunctional regulatory protein [Burkholderiales bacterium]
MADTNSFSKFVPGFEFLENLVKNAGSALPSMGQWVVPTLDPDELDRRIKDLRTVQFWLDQNSRMLATTIQALEVQRMTLSALKGMNVTVNEMHDALKARPTPSPSPSAGFASPSPAPSAAPPADSAEGGAPAAVVDAMQWWGALTQQFTQLASQAMQAAGEVAVPAAGAKAASDSAKGAGAAAESKAAPGAAKSASAKRPSTAAGSPAGRKTG